MEQILITIFSEKGIIYGLFVFSFFMAIYKGVPYAVAKFEAVVKQFAELKQEQHKMFETSLNKISETFVNQIATSNEWHKSHNEHLARIEEGIKKI